MFSYQHSHQAGYCLKIKIFHLHVLMYCTKHCIALLFGTFYYTFWLNRRSVRYLNPERDKASTKIMPCEQYETPAMLQAWFCTSPAQACSFLKSDTFHIKILMCSVLHCHPFLSQSVHLLEVTAYLFRSPS